MQKIQLIKTMAFLGAVIVTTPLLAKPVVELDPQEKSKENLPSLWYQLGDKEPVLFWSTNETTKRPVDIAISKEDYKNYKHITFLYKHPKDSKYTPCDNIDNEPVLLNEGQHGDLSDVQIIFSKGSCKVNSKSYRP